MRTKRTIDRRDCPDWMNIRQFIYLENTSPRVLISAIYPTSREPRKRESGWQRRSVNPAGMIRQRFPQRFERGSRCSLCGVHTVRGDDVAYWGGEPKFGHALCRVAEWTARHDAAEKKRRDDAEQARRRRSQSRRASRRTLEAATRDFERNRAAVLEGETFRSGRQSDYRLGGPSRVRTRR